ncbi:MAG: DUF2889 domain-containing protein [Deltaproteobacteria bacterium]|nr:DUF2889 domain-containing protein [Deltaproteobacteria bacterium]
MQSAWKSKGKKCHTRSIQVTTYERDGKRIIVEGVLKDERFQESHVITGETFPSGVVHHMAIRLLVDCSTLLIEAVDVDLIAVPREACRETIDCLSQIRGLTVTKGFTAKVKKMAGGVRGCTHLVELILAMAPAVIQGFGAHQSSKPQHFDAGHAKLMVQFLVNTCRIWREDGPLVEIFKRKIEARQAKG